MQHKFSIDPHVQSIYQNHHKNHNEITDEEIMIFLKLANMNLIMPILVFMFSIKKLWKVFAMPLNRFSKSFDLFQIKFTLTNFIQTKTLPPNPNYQLAGVMLILPLWTIVTLMIIMIFHCLMMTCHVNILCSIDMNFKNESTSYTQALTIFSSFINSYITLPFNMVSSLFP